MFGYLIDKESKRLAVFIDGEPDKSAYPDIDIQDYEVEQDWRGDYYMKGYSPVQSEKEKQLEAYQAELAEKEQWLRDHDYIGVKIATGRATAEEYADEIATMTQCAARVEELRALMAELEAG